ncbi:LOW QUALITY PROTEIN: hypothetical protein ACHAXR_010534, partial [Thalassiosira sp. AJA248-18]
VARVRVDPSVTRIPPRAFQDQRKLEEVELCEGLQEIGENAFRGCVSLRRIKIPSTVVRMLDYAFYNCTLLEEVELIREGLPEIIGADVFCFCTSLRNIVIPEAATEVVSADVPVIVPTNENNTESEIELRTMETQTVMPGLRALREVVLNEGLQKIGLGAFQHCSLLESIWLPSTVSEVEMYAFYNCREMREVVLNEGLQHIGQCAFRGCVSLKSIKFPSTLTEVVSHAFYHCIKLKEVVLNERLRTIGKGAFRVSTFLAFQSLFVRATN